MRFLDPRILPAGESVVRVGGRVDAESLVEAYSHGIFPWPMSLEDTGEMVLLWHSPDPRGILDLESPHIPRRLERTRERGGFEIRFDSAFREVIEGCAGASRPDGQGTWITPELIQGYTELFAGGWAHSVECYSSGTLTGGLYGVFINGVFSGESMFFRERDASKLCLLALIEELAAAGLRWMDIQMVTPVTEQFGGRYIPRSEYLDRLEAARDSALAKKLKF